MTVEVNSSPTAIQKSSPATENPSTTERAVEPTKQVFQAPSVPQPDPPITSIILEMIKDIQKEMREIKAERNQWIMSKHP